MNRIAWCTDIHLDHLKSDQDIVKFSETIKSRNVEGVIITGDISNSQSIVLHLSMLERLLQFPVYFVLGNHDYYGSDVATVREQMKEVSNMSGFLRYLPTTPYVTLSPSTALIGHDGWYDALYGDYKKSQFVMADWRAIRDFVDVNSMLDERTPNYSNIVMKARELASGAVQHVHAAIKGAIRHHKNIVIATHFPPFEKLHRFRGKPGDFSVVPWYTSKMMGDLILSAAKSFPDVNFTVLAGHTHGFCSERIAGNVHCYVGGATYGAPSVADVLIFG